MPTVLRRDGYRVYFVSHDCREPAHVHVDRAGRSAKIWLHPLTVAANLGFRHHELNAIIGMLKREQARLLEAWDEHCGRAPE